MEQHSRSQELGELSSHNHRVSSASAHESNMQTQRSLNLRPLLKVIKRNLLLIAGATGVTTATLLAWNSTLPPVYQGNFQLLVEPVTSEARLAEPLSLTRGEGTIPSDRSFSLDYPTQLTILQSPQVLSGVVQQINTKFPTFSFSRLRHGLRIERLGDNKKTLTKIIKVTYQDVDPQLVQLVLEKVAEKYLRYSLDERKSRIGAGVKFIENQLPELQQRVSDLQLKLQELQRTYQVIDPSTKGENLYGQIRNMAGQQLEIQRQLKAQKALATSLEQQLKLTSEEAFSASTLSQNPNYQNLITRLKELEIQISIEESRLQSDNPKLLSLKEQHQNLKDLQKQETQKILGQDFRGTSQNTPILKFQPPLRQTLIQQLVTTANEIQVLESNLKSLEKDKNTLEQQAQQIPQVVRLYTELQQQLAIANRTVSQLLTQRDTLQIEAAQTEVPWELIAQPSVQGGGKATGDPDQTLKILVAGVLSGSILGLAIAIILERRRETFLEADDIQEGMAVPLLGIIPYHQYANNLARTSAPSKIGPELGIGEDNTSQFLSSFDTLYANLCFLYTDPSIRSVVITSSELGDGKSTVALYLAQTAAAMEQKVLLVDTNWHSPCLHELLDVPNQFGINNLLIDKKATENINGKLETMIQSSSLADNLYILTAGPSLPVSTRLIASARMQQIMDKLESTFDLVIYDTPFIFSSANIDFLAANTDGAILVVAVNKTKRSKAIQMLNQLDNFQLPCLGAVVNHLATSESVTWQSTGNLFGRGYQKLLNEDDKTDVIQTRH